MIHTATNGMTWDLIAYRAGLSEFSMDDVMADNSYYYSDVVLFEGGEQVSVSTEPVVQDATIKTPWG